MLTFVNNTKLHTNRSSIKLKFLTYSSEGSQVGLASGRIHSIPWLSSEILLSTLPFTFHRLSSFIVTRWLSATDKMLYHSYPWGQKAKFPIAAKNQTTKKPFSLSLMGQLTNYWGKNDVITLVNTGLMWRKVS